MYCKKIILVAALLLSYKSFGNDLEAIYEIIKKVESNDNPKAIGDNGRAYGVVQIHNICVEDINRIYGSNFTHEQAFNREHSKMMFILYLRHGIKLFRRKYNKSPNEEDIVRMWNGSIYNGYRKESTKKYYKKYKEVKNDSKRKSKAISK